MKINLGYIDKVSGNFIKIIVFSKAVLWKDKQLSLPVSTMKKIISLRCPKMVFKDETKKEEWWFETSKVTSLMTLKKVGQEPQYYFPIDLARKVKLDFKPLVEPSPEDPQTKLF